MLVDIVHALGVFNFGDQSDAVVAVALQLLAHFHNVFCLPGKGGGDEIRFHLTGETDILPVSVAHKGKGQADVRNVDSLVGGHRPAVDNGTVNIGIGGLHNRQFDEAVVNENAAARMDIMGKTGKADGGDRGVSIHSACGQGERTAGFQHHLVFPEGAQPDFRPLGIDQNCHRQSQFFPERFDHVDALQMALMGLVRHVDTRHVHTGEHQLPKNMGIVGRGPQSADDFGFAHGRFLLFRLAL